MSVFLVLSILFSFSMFAFATDTNNNVITKDSEYYLTPEEIMNGDYFPTEEIEKVVESGAVILGGIDAPMSELIDESSGSRLITGQVWCRSYATYDEDEGVSVHIELYVPWWYFANPKFNGMSETVNVNLERPYYKTFVAVANEADTIDTDVDTKATAPSGTEGTVNIVGIAIGTNIASGAGEFASSYEITIP